MSFLDNLTFEAGVVARSVGDYLRGGALRLGVTGLSRAGKTVFVTALVNNLLARRGCRCSRPRRRAASPGRSSSRSPTTPCRAFPTRSISPRSPAPTGTGRNRRGASRSLRAAHRLRARRRLEPGPARLDLDIVDYPGEWLLDLTLLDKSYAQWSQRDDRGEPRAGARRARRRLARPSRRARSAGAVRRGRRARQAAALFTDYLRAARADAYALSTLPPGRFLMPGDLEGSPALTFAPLPSRRTSSRRRDRSRR